MEFIKRAIICSKMSDLTFSIGTFFNARNISCGKVMFLHLSVILFRGGGCVVTGVCMAKGGMHGKQDMHGEARACMAKGGGHVW